MTRYTTSYTLMTISAWGCRLGKIKVGYLNTELSMLYDKLKGLSTIALTTKSRLYIDDYQYNVEKLEGLWTRSRRQFHREYPDNREENWGDRARRHSLPQSPGNLSHVEDTNQFVAFLEQHPDSLPGYTLVDRELNPCRITNAVYPDGQSAKHSGAGGMDILLRSCSNRLPVVGEVKVKKDKNSFYALIQAMRYASELSTPNQLERLGRHFSQFDQRPDAIEIVIVMVNREPEDQTVEGVLQLLGQLNARGNCSRLGRLRLLINRGEEWLVAPD